MKFISLCFANVVNIKGICNKKTEKRLDGFKERFFIKKVFSEQDFGTDFVLCLIETKN